MSTRIDAMNLQVGPMKRFVRLTWYELREGTEWEQKAEMDYEKAMAVVRAYCPDEWVQMAETTKP